MTVVKLEDFALNKDKKVSNGKTISNIGVYGCGSKGLEIAKYVSQQGFDVILTDDDKELLENSLKNIEKNLDATIAHWGLTSGEKKAILNRIKTTDNVDELASCDIIIEAIFMQTTCNKSEKRKDVLNHLGQMMDKNTVYISNTASIMISDLIGNVKYPENVLGAHLHTPIEHINTVEVVCHAKTADTALEKVNKFIKMLNKDSIVLDETPGNIITRMTIPFINEACHILLEGVATVSDIDKAMKANFGNQSGPFEIADKVGLDILSRWMDNLYQEYGDNKYKASPVIKKLVRANHLGVKTGIGFYKYENGQAVKTAISAIEITE